MIALAVIVIVGVNVSVNVGVGVRVGVCVDVVVGVGVAVAVALDVAIQAMFCAPYLTCSLIYSILYYNFDYIIALTRSLSFTLPHYLHSTPSTSLHSFSVFSHCDHELKIPIT